MKEQIGKMERLERKAEKITREKMENKREIIYKMRRRKKEERNEE